jgi:hypothetical protein
MVPADSTPHRRDDGELLGWIRPLGDAWVAVDLLGRAVSGAQDWLDAEDALEAGGLAWLAEPWVLTRGGVDLRVRLVEITPDAGRVVVKTDDFGAIDAPHEVIVLPWPAPESLRPWRVGDPDGRELFA